jgi:NAD(P)-dependent dehydrogenase (short-subunit alcohol dehydrogenase family)
VTATCKTALVTGASSGIGEAIAIRFAQEGANVAINYMSSEGRAKDLAAKIEKEYGVKVMIIQGVRSAPVQPSAN